jgi:peptidoglycan hydrolase CwlO-like protein
VAIDPAQAAAGGAVGSVLLMLIVRFLLRQYGEIPVDRKRAAADGARAEAESAVHDGYRKLVKDFRDEIDRLHNQVRRMEASIDECEARHRERDERDEIRADEMRELKTQLRERGVL